MVRIKNKKIILLNHDDIFNIFWNRYLIETSNLDRAQKLSKNYFYRYHIMFYLKFLIKELISIISLLKITFYLFLNYSKNHIPKNIFLYTHYHQINKENEKNEYLRTGLFPMVSLRNFNNHIYKFLYYQEFLYVIFKSFLIYPYLIKNLERACKIRNISFLNYVFFNNINLSSIIELNLLNITLKKIDNIESISCSSQFCPYLQLLSLFKVQNKKSKWILNLYQHGVYEIDRLKREYRKVYADNIFYKYSSSLKWLKLKYIFNKNCNFFRIEKINKENFIDLSKYTKGKLIAYASSGFFERDHIILRKLISIQERMKDLSIIYYPHPEFVDKANEITRRYSSIKVSKYQRYRKINLLITGYSSLGLDYINLDVNVLFIPFDDSICAFKDKSLNVLMDFNFLDQEVDKLII